MKDFYSELSLKKAKEHYKKLPNRVKNTKFMREFYSELELKDQLLKNENSLKLWVKITNYF